MSARAFIGPGDLPLLARDEREPYRLSRSSVEAIVLLLAGELAELECAWRSATGHALPRIARDRDVVLNALAELRGAE